MRVRRCATEGCRGTLPIGIGKHCPRCGGTAFIPQKRRGGRVVLIILASFAVAAIVRFFRSHAGLPSTETSDRSSLVEAHDLAANMTGIDARDEAYAEILHHALAQRDFDYACQVGDEMTEMNKKDKCLLETVEAALQAHQPGWAHRAADEIMEMSMRDEAFRKIMDRASGK